MASTGLTNSATDAEDDASVVRRVLDGDPMAFALLMRRFNRRLYRVARAIMGDDTEVEAVPSDEVGSPDAAADRAQMRAILERRIDALPEAFRAVLVLRSVEELSVEETAQCLGIPAETVRSRHFRAKSLLREALAREVDTASGACGNSPARAATG